MVENGATFVSSLTIASICFEGYYAISNPQKARNMFNKKRTIFVLFIIWVIGVSISIPYWFITLQFNSQCDLEINNLNLTFIVTLNILFIILPITSLIALYLYIIIKARMSYSKFLKILAEENMHNESYELDELNAGLEEQRRKSQVKLNGKSKFEYLIKFSIVTIVFICCQLPVRAFLCWSYYTTYNSFYAQNYDGSLIENNFRLINLVSNTCTLIYYLHCVSNPVIFFILSVKFQKAL